MADLFGGAAGGIGTDLSSWIGKNPGLLLGGAALGANMLMGNQPLPAEKQIQQQAGEAQTQAQTLMAYQTSGTLPPGLQAVVDEQFNAAKAADISQYSKLGLGSSTMLTDKLNQLKAAKSAEVAQFADMLSKEGIQFERLSASEFGTVLQAQQVRDQTFMSAAMTFAKGLAGGGLNTPNTTTV